MVLERDFQAKLVKKIKKTIPGASVMKTDPNQIQGIPDLLILHKGRFASLEVKRSSNASRRPNQEYFINKINDDGGFARFVDPSNESEVISEMETYFEGE